MSETPSDIAYSNRYTILAAVMMGTIMGPLDASVVNVVLPTIAQHFHAGVAAAEWVQMVYLLTIGSLLLFYGRLGDIIGYRKIYLTGLAGFVVTSALCGHAPSLGWLIVFRGLQGLAAGMLMSMPFAILTAVFPAHERGRAIGINAISVSAGLALGPALGGFLTDLAGWRLVFLINVPIGIAALFWGRRIIPDLRGRKARFDLTGVLLGSFSLLLLLLSIHQFQTARTSPLTLGLFVIALASVAAFLWTEVRVAEPMLDLGLFRSPTVSLATASALLNFMSQYILVFLTPFYLQRVLHFDAEHLGLIMTAFPLAVMVVAPFSGTLSDRIGTSLLACVGAGLCAVSLFLMGRLPVDARAADVVWRVALFGLGTGIFQSPNNSAVMGSVPKPRLGIASGVIATVRTIGMVMGIATGGAVLSAYVPSALLKEPALFGAAATLFLTGLEYAYITGGVLTGIAAVTSLARSRDRK